MNKTAASIKLINDNRQAVAMLNPLRIRILQHLREPDSASGLARRFGIARQKLNYHLRELEKHGLIEAVEERKKGNCTERIVRAVSRAYLISPEALGSLAADPDQAQDRFSSTYLVAIAARAIQDLTVLRASAEESKQKLPTLGLDVEVRFASAAERNSFAEELSSTFAKLAARYHNSTAASGRTFRIFAGAYPSLTKKIDRTGKIKPEE